MPTASRTRCHQRRLCALQPERGSHQRLSSLMRIGRQASARSEGLPALVESQGVRRVRRGYCGSSSPALRSRARRGSSLSPYSAARAVSRRSGRHTLGRAEGEHGALRLVEIEADGVERQAAKIQQMVDLRRGVALQRFVVVLKVAPWKALPPEPAKALVAGAVAHHVVQVVAEMHPGGEQLAVAGETGFRPSR